VALDEALKALEQTDPRKSRIVELRFFGGMSIEETAEALTCRLAPSCGNGLSLGRGCVTR